MYYCRKCGKPIEGYYKFCPKCGEPVDQELLKESMEPDAGEDGETVLSHFSEDYQPEQTEGRQQEDGDNYRYFDRQEYPYKQGDFSYDYKQPEQKRTGKRNFVILLIILFAAVAAALAAFWYFSGRGGSSKVVDPFAGVEVNYTGASPYLKASVTVDKDDAVEKQLHYVLSKSGNIKKGDEITVYVTADEDVMADSSGTVNVDEDDVTAYMKKNFHVTPKRVSKTFVARDVDSYLTSVDDIPSDVLTSMQEAAEKKVADNAKNWSGANLSGSEYLGAYFLSPKGGREQQDITNALFLINRVDVSFTNGDFFSYYYYTEYTNLMEQADGTVDVDVNQFQAPSGQDEIRSGSSYMSYNGYEDLSSLYNEVIATQDKDYEIENKVEDNPKQSSLSHAGNSSSGTGSNQTAGTGSVNGGTSPAEKSSPDSPGGHSTTDGQIFPNSSTELLTSSDISSLTSEQAQDAINEIYAREGYIFKESPYKEYYAQFSWYHKTYSDMQTVPLNTVEYQNVQMLSKAR